MLARRILLICLLVSLCASLTAQEPFPLKPLPASPTASPAQEPFPLHPLPEISPAWILDIATDADFDLVDRTAAVSAAQLVLREKRDKRIDLHARRILFLDAHYSNRAEEAERYLDQLAALDPDNPEYALRLMQRRSLDRLEDVPKELAQMKLYLKKYSHYPPAIYMQWQILQLVGKYDEALALVDEALKSHPQDGLLHATKAAVLLSLGKSEEALDCSDKAMLCAPPLRHTHFVYLSRAEILLALGRSQDALQMSAYALRLLSPIEREHRTAKILAFVSKCYGTMQEYELCYYAAKSMVKYQPQLDESWHMLTNACLLTGRYEEGQQAIEKYAQLDRRTSEYYRLKLMLHLGRKELQEALKVSVEGIEKFPDETRIAFFRIYALAATKTDENVGIARQMIAAGIKKQQDQAVWHYLDAIVSSRMQDFAKAGEALKKARSFNTDGATNISLTKAREAVSSHTEITIDFPEETSSDTFHPDLALSMESEADFNFVSGELVEQQCYEKLQNPDEDDMKRLKAAEVLIRLYKLTHRANEVNECVEQLVKLDPSNANYRREQVLHGLSESPLAAQCQSLEKFCKEFPEDKESEGLWALTLCNMGSLQQAGALADRLLRVAPNHPRGLEVKALAELRTGHSKKSLEYSDKWLCQSDELLRHASAYYTRAEILISLDRNEEALANLAIVKRLVSDPKMMKDVRELTARAYRQLKKDTLADHFLPLS